MRNKGEKRRDEGEGGDADTECQRRKVMMVSCDEEGGGVRSFRRASAKRLCCGRQQGLASRLEKEKARDSPGIKFRHYAQKRKNKTRGHDLDAVWCWTISGYVFLSASRRHPKYSCSSMHCLGQATDCALNILDGVRKGSLRFLCRLHTTSLLELPQEAAQL